MRPSTSHNNAQTQDRAWLLADADGKVLGRLARDIAYVLQGKHKPTVSEHYDCGDSVVVVNCEKVAVTGRKAEDKQYVHYTGYPGGRREIPYATVKGKHPERLLQKAVERMLPKTKLGRQMRKNLFVYAGGEHPHAAQQPAPLPDLS
ncbi:MAG: 50S ribosomal protein L13 [Planctomycetota bacterium]|jgi:large subunit ribosomal protein L13|nr:50S ribosomal protein L13 [Planctomycetota bacterium]